MCAVPWLIEMEFVIQTLLFNEWKNSDSPTQ